MKIGTKTLLFGCHQFVLHPIYTYVAWRKLYGNFPSLGETVAIVIHDWGYFGKLNLDGKEGERHPEWANNIFERLGHFVRDNINFDFGVYFYELGNLCLYHSRFYAKKFEQEPSKLCWADKYGTILYSKYLWSFLATISGELKEYMTNDKYEIYYKGAENDGTFLWFTEYVKFMMPMIKTEVSKINNENNKHDRLESSKERN